MKIFSLLIILSPIFSSYAVTKLTTSKHDLDSVEIIKKVELSLNERSFDKSLLTKAHTLLQSNAKFEKYETTTRSLLDFHRKYLSGTYSFEDCIFEDKESNAFINKFNFSANKYCQAFFISHFTKNPKTFTNNDIFLQKNLNNFLQSKGYAQTEFIKFLSTLKEENNSEYTKLSNMALASLRENELIVNINLLPSLFHVEKVNSILTDSKIKSKFFDNVSTLSIEDQVNKISQKIDSNPDQVSQSLTALYSFFTNVKDQLDLQEVYVDLIRIGKKLITSHQSGLAIQHFKFLDSNFKGLFSSDLYFHSLWACHYLNDLACAAKLVSENKLNFENLDTATKFWVSYTNLKSKNITLAKQQFEQVIKSDPLSYYSIVSLKYLGSIDSKNSAEFLIKSMYQTKSLKALAQISLSSTDLEHIDNILIFSELNDHFRTSLAIEDYIQYMRTDSKLSLQDKTDLTHYLVKFLGDNKQNILSFKLYFSFIEQLDAPINTKTLTLAFPLDYTDNINRYSKSIHPSFVMSLIRQESGFNAQAKSQVGALGLMQLMPQTAKMFKKRVRAKELMNPKTNIQIGISYLENLFRKYDGNIIYLLSAYNAGEGRVSQWRQNVFKNEDNLLQIEAIPYKETRQYVKLIYRNMFFYKMLTSDSELISPVEKSFKITRND